MGPATPNFNFAQQAGPSSPPQTPTTSTSTYVLNKTQNRRHGQHFGQPPQLPPQRLHGNGNIIPNGQGPNSFCYVPSPRPADLSPRSSSPDSSVATSDSGSPPRSLASSPAEPMSSSPPLRKKTIIAQGKCNFTVEEFGASDYEDFDSDDSVIHAHEYEEPDSDRPPSIKAPHRSDLDPKIYRGFQNLNTEEDDIMGPELDREAWLEKVRAERRRKRRSSGSVKRVFSQSIGSDTDDEDIQPVTFEGANSARRLRRKTATGDRASLIFDDPPPRIDELEEPESCEELVDIRESDDEKTGGLRELPYYVQDMDVDSSDDDEDEEEDEEDEEDDEDEDEE